MHKTIALLAALAVASSPVMTPGTAHADRPPTSNQFWWPDKLDLAPLRQHAAESNPYGENFNYAEAFKTLDIEAVKKDIQAVMTTSQDWWPADYGNYGPFFI